MSDIMRPRYGTKAENDGYIGLDGEISIDRETQHLRIHDGVTAGGAKVVANQDEVKVVQDGLQGLQEAVDSIDVGVTSFNGAKGAVTYSAPVSSVNGQTGAVTVDVGVTSVNGQTGVVAISVPPTPNAYVTQTYRSGTTWYRKWSDGFIQQGGQATNAAGKYATVTFPQAMSAVLNVTIAAMKNDKNYVQKQTIEDESITTTGFHGAVTDYAQNKIAGTFCWSACGYV